MREFLHPRHFTLTEARAALPGVRERMGRILALKHRLEERGYDVTRHEYFGGSGPNGERFFPAELEELVEIARKINSMGVLIKDLDAGLIDFPFLRSNGEEAYLCWKFGEDDIQYWHTIDGGFAGRRPVTGL